ncbi:MAG: 2-oxo acid dehydrogenase subunit E2, partial [Chitinophagaceae bacterium]
MALVDLIMPKMGESIMEATILRWYKSVGEFVKMDETLLDIATDKVDSEVPSTAEGIVKEILFNPNDVVAIGAVIARVETDINAIEESNVTPAVTTAAPLVTETAVNTPEEVPFVPTPSVIPVAQQQHFAPTSASVKPANNKFFSPLVLNIANSEGLSLSELERITGTGADGRVSKKDVLQYIADKKAGKIPTFEPVFVPQQPVYQQPVAPVAQVVQPKPSETPAPVVQPTFVTTHEEPAQLVIAKENVAEKVLIPQPNPIAAAPVVVAPIVSNIPESISVVAPTTYQKPAEATPVDVPKPIIETPVAPTVVQPIVSPAVFEHTPTVAPTPAVEIPPHSIVSVPPPPPAPVYVAPIVTQVVETPIQQLVVQTPTVQPSIAPTATPVAETPIAKQVVAPTPTAPAPVIIPQVIAVPKIETPLPKLADNHGKYSFPSQAIPTGNTEIVEMDRMRKLIAKHMVDSKHTSAHVTSFSEADVTNMVLWRERVKADFERRENTKITFTPMFLECIINVLKRYPMMNSSVDGDRIIIKKDVNLGMATALPSGNLIVPVIKAANQLNIVGLATAVNQLAATAREGKLKPDDTQGGTFTFTNVGTFGSLMGTPIINQPQVAILSVGTIKKRPVVLETDNGDTIGI